jgi:hypothetical protein
MHFEEKHMRQGISNRNNNAGISISQTEILQILLLILCAGNKFTIKRQHAIYYALFVRT